VEQRDYILSIFLSSEVFPNKVKINSSRGSRVVKKGKTSFLSAIKRKSSRGASLYLVQKNANFNT